MDGNFQANTDRTTDRCQLPGIYAAMHRIGERSKDMRALLDTETSRTGLEDYLETLKYILPFTGVVEDITFINSEIIRVEALLSGNYRSLVTSGTNVLTYSHTLLDLFCIIITLKN
jgi:hypothetical protein